MQGCARKNAESNCWGGGCSGAVVGGLRWGAQQRCSGAMTPGAGGWVLGQKRGGGAAAGATGDGRWATSDQRDQMRARHTGKL